MADFLDVFHFVRPWWFLAVLPVLLLTVLLWLGQKNSRQWQHYISPHLLPFLLDTTQVEQKRWPLLGLSALWLACTFALAGPAWEKVPQPVEQDVSALVICWDLSPSMLAEDVKPSRLLRSRLKIIDLLQSRQEGQVALIAYSGEAYTVTPLTDDTQTIINLLPALSPTTLPTVGSNPEMALEQAQKLLKDAGVLRGDILFITDEIDTSAFNYFENQIRKSAHQLSFWAVGTKEGAPIPLPSGGFAKTNGNMVVAKVNEQEMLGLARSIGAYYIPMQTLDSDIDDIKHLLSSSLDEQTQTTERVFDQWFEHGQFLALLFLPFVAYFFRRGLIFSVFFLIALPFASTQEAYAFGWNDLWLTQDQQAQLALEAGDEEAAQRFTGHQHRGAALYQQGKFEESIKAFAQGDDVTDFYNKGNALTRAGQFEDAIKAYDQALEQNPNYTEASENRDIAKKLAELAKQEQNGENQDGEKQQDKKNSDQDSEQQKDGDQSQQQDSQSQDGQDQDSQQQSSDKQKEGEQDSSEQQQAGQEGEQQNPEDNPYSQENLDKQNQEQKEQSEQEQLAQQGEEPSEQEPLSEEQAKALAQAMQMTDEETEEKQKLEQWLRKVPDDPSGLMRNKFQYEYNKRRQEIQTPSSYSNDDPEERW